MDKRRGILTSGLLWQQVLILCLLILYRIMLDFSYEEVARMFDYQGLFANNKSGLSLLLSWVLFIISLPFIVRMFDGENFSNYVLILFVLFSLIPEMVVIAHRADYSFHYLILITCFWLLLLLSHFLIPPLRFRFSPHRLFTKTPYFILAILIATVLVYSYVTTGLRLHLDLINVYEIREEAQGFGFIFPFNYLLSFADNILPFFAVLLLHRRRYIYFGLTILVIFINFSITGTKQIAFILLCGIVGYYLIRSHKNLFRILIAANALIAFAFIEIIMLDTRVLSIIYPYRVLFMPAELHNSYFSFFQINELDFYRQSILKVVLKSPYETNIQYLLGGYSVGDITARANNGLFSDAYMNLGALGVFIHPFLIVIMLRLFDGVVSRIDTRLWFVLAIYIAFVMLGMTLSNALLTAGFVPCLLMLYFFPRADRTAGGARRQRYFP